MKKYSKILYLVLMVTVLFACKKHNIKTIEDRNFKMGFSTWSYGPTAADRENNYALIRSHGDIYSEQVDDRIPWTAWIEGTPLPSDFVADIDYRASKKTADMSLLLSVSILNTDRSDFNEDWTTGEVPTYSTMSDAVIENAYVDHVFYLVERLNPDYLVISMESNDLLKHSESKWEEFKVLMGNVRSRVHAEYPDLKISESITLHNWYNPETENAEGYQNELKAYLTDMDFNAISFYPFFVGLDNAKGFQKAFDFLHANTNGPIAFVETTHLANDLEVDAYDLYIKSNVKEQNAYLEALLANAASEDYLFIIWWAFRDYDALWETFPEEVKDIGKLWRDTGLEDENGNGRPALETWKSVFEK